jgi:hypothetical protein
MGAVHLAAAEETVQMAEWSHRADVQLAGEPEAGLAEVPLPPEVLDIARSDLADLRLVDAAGRQTPHTVRVARGSTRRVELRADLLNRTYRPGESSSATVDFGREVLKNRLEVDTPGTDFRRRVQVEASDDARSWQVARAAAFLFRISRPHGYEKNEVAIPENDQRYLRITVYNASDDPERVQIRSVRAWQRTHTPAAEVLLETVRTEVIQQREDRRTDITLDLGHRNLPLARLELDFVDANFFRRAEVFGRERLQEVVETPREQAPPVRETREAPWRYITAALLYRYSAGDRADESLTVDLDPAQYRYVQVRVHNQDNPPLALRAARVTRFETYLAFEPRGPGGYTLCLGNPEARKPLYDLPRYADRLRRQGIVGATVGPLQPNPLYGEGGEGPPWSERHRGIIWIALLVAGLVLGLLIYRETKRAPSAGSS